VRDFECPPAPYTHLIQESPLSFLSMECSPSLLFCSTHSEFHIQVNEKAIQLEKLEIMHNQCQPANFNTSSIEQHKKLTYVNKGKCMHI